MNRSLLLSFAALLPALFAVQRAATESRADQIPTDWDLYMMRLVNQARVDPAGEDARQGTAYGETPVAPLAYDVLVGEAAQNHNQWMGANRNNPAINNPANPGPAPDSFTHYETLNAQSGGTPASGTPGFTGVSVTDRFNFVGYSWSRAGENIFWRSNTPAINAALIDQNHAGWWNSSGHRTNMMNGNYKVFGHHIMNDDNNWATQNFGAPLGQPANFIFGVLFDDLDLSGDWTPRDAGDPLREGLGGISFDVLPDGGGPAVASGSTWDNGSYSAAVADGTYDLLFTGAGLPGGSWQIDNLVVAGANVNAGDTLVPEPSTLVLAALGLLGLAAFVQRRGARRPGPC